MTFALACALLACKTKKNAMADEFSISEQEMKITAEIGSTKEVSDPFEIKSCEIKGNTMLMTITYRGGCDNHLFKVLGNPAIMKSLPPIRSVQVFHKDKGDECNDIITKDLIIDIHELAYIQEEGSVIYLTVDGWEDRLTYTFSTK